MADSPDERKPANHGDASRKVLWIGWDGADWDHILPLLDQGLLPNLESLINDGVMGNLATLQPVLSPMLWNSASTGKYPFKHGILGFTEADQLNGGVRPYSSYSRKCRAIWNILSGHGLRSNVVNWWGSHPAEKINGCVVSNMMEGVKFDANGPIVPEGTVHPADKASFYGQFKVMAEEIEAEQICAFIPEAHRLNQDEDSRLQMFAKTFAETLTTHATATAVMEKEPWDFMAVYYTCIDHFAHGFMPYHPPKLDRVSDEDFEIFKDVVTGAYRFSDMMLGRMLEFCDEDTTVIVCSDHGFHSGHLRPEGQPRDPSGPTIWHRDYGMFVMKGPNIKKDERIHGASLIDLTPTILAVMGLPQAEDMDGRPLLDAFVEPPEIDIIPSWDTQPCVFEDGMHTEEKPLPPEESEELIRQFVALGYIDDPTGDKHEHANSTDIECKYNCARSYMFANRADDALPLFKEVVERAPWETRFVLQLANCYRAAGYLRQAKRVYQHGFDIDATDTVVAVIDWIDLSLQLGDSPLPLYERLKKLESHPATASPDLANRIGRLYARQRRWEDAGRLYERAVAVDPENAFALQALSRIYSRRHMDAEAAETALRAVGLVHRLPHAHLNLGIVMARHGEADRAVMALKTAIQFSPKFAPAHRVLSFVYAALLKDPKKAMQHRKLARQYRTEQSKTGRGKVERMELTFDLPDIPSEEDRYETLLKKRPDKGDPRKPSGKEFVIVSGLPRSGTSLMMQLLEAGGLPPKTDGKREADPDNPKGYYEWEEIKQIARQPELFDDDDLDGLAIKAVSKLLPELPYNHRYKVIFMTRPVEEVVASQGAMIERLKSEGSTQAPDNLAETLVNHRNQVMSWMEHHPRIESLEIDYPSLVENPEEIVPLIGEFLGNERISNIDAMMSVVDASLYRQRKP